MNEFRFICARLILDERVLKILSVTERHICGWCGACVSASVSNLAMNRLAYDGAMHVPMAVPCVWM